MPSGTHRLAESSTFLKEGLCRASISTWTLVTTMKWERSRCEIHASICATTPGICTASTRTPSTLNGPSTREIVREDGSIVTDIPFYAQQPACWYTQAQPFYSLRTPETAVESSWPRAGLL